uniref:Glycosyltransferase 2-like domain-containing protein n=1 Tax=viral metagenome TaxID=1070528 RepID=A0A6C0IJA0_9ZZZZ
MTIINGIELDNINYKTNDIKYAIKNNDPIEAKLNVIIVISNPCLYTKRYLLFKEFVSRMENEEEHVNLCIVELIYGEQKFVVTDKNNKNHLQIKTDTPIWHKENMVNLGVKYLLPKNYKAFAWIDADLEFENNTWALDTLKILNGCKDVLHLFSHCIDMNHDETTLNAFNSLGYCYTKGKDYTIKGLDYWHPGYAWAMTRKAYEKIGGLYDKGVLGSGDSIMALAFINKVSKMFNAKYHSDYNNSMLEFQEKVKGLRIGYTPGVIRHHYHGTKQNRQYTERWKIIMNHAFSPITHLTYDEKGILIPTKDFSEEFKADIMKYFKERKEDD